jgi:hypothetical protein
MFSTSFASEHFFDFHIPNSGALMRVRGGGQADAQVPWVIGDNDSLHTIT